MNEQERKEFEEDLRRTWMNYWKYRSAYRDYEEAIKEVFNVYSLPLKAQPSYEIILLISELYKEMKKYKKTTKYLIIMTIISVILNICLLWFLFS